MAIRESINAHPKSTIGVVSGVIVVIVAFGLYSARTPQLSLPTQAYFSDDDGKTFFVDSVTKVAPFDRGGRQVVAAHVFQYGDGKLFVGYVERAISAEAKAAVERDRAEIAAIIVAHPTAGPDGELVTRVKKNLEVKRPGDTTWVGAESSKAIAIYQTIWTGSGTPTEVNP